MTTRTTADDLIVAARHGTGLEDLGSESFREGLDRYWESVATEAQLNEFGAAAMPATITAALANRLRVVDWAKTHPEVAEERIESPLVVIGMFRAGTTFLSYLLDQDRGNRPLLGWESRDSAPPPTPADHRVGPRVEAVRAGAAILEQVNPGLDAIHHEDPDGPTECISVMAQDFKSLSWEAIANVPTYGDWLYSTDQTSAYEYHRLVLQILQSGGVRGRWTLKSPHHAIGLDALTAVYPDAQLVLLHRDPVVLCASVCSLIRALSSTFSDADHRDYIAAHWTSMLETSVTRINAFRDARPDHPIIDVQYADLVQDPVETVSRIYEATGRELDAVARSAMSDYVGANRKGKFGVHGYDLADFGLDGGELAERFAGYVARYDVRPERPARA